MKTSIRLNGISKKYRMYDSPSERFKDIMSNNKEYGVDKYALKDINLEIPEGEILGIIGTNGSGKSTLLKIITGVLKPSSGTVEVNGKISALLELGAGFNPEYTGVENIFFNGMLMGFSRNEMDKKVEEIIDFADIGEYINQPVRTYSSGMIVRLAYAVAVNIEPDILIVDEALAVGDAYFQLKSMTKMQELFKKGKTVLLVSHDIGSIKSLCNKVLYLNNGEAVAYGDAKTVVDMYEKSVRERMSETAKISEESNLNEDDVLVLDDIEKGNGEFSADEAFCKRVEKLREGNGKAKAIAVCLQNIVGRAITKVEFNQECILKILVEFYESCDICVGYHIRNERNIIILGSNTSYEGMKLIRGAAGDRITVEFRFNLPVIEGRYNVMTVLSRPALENLSSEFVDITKDGFYFDVEQAKPNRIWNALQLPNSVQVYKVN